MRLLRLHAFDAPALSALRRHRLLRRFALLLAALMLVPTLLPTAAAAQQATAQRSKAAVSGLALSASERLADTPYLAPAQAAPHAALSPGGAPSSAGSLMPATVRPQAPSSPTLLDEVGLLAHPVPAATVAGWVTELKGANIAPQRAALLHLWLGEWQLAHSQQPETARQHFWHAQQWAHKDALLPGHAPVAKRLYGLVAYDSATALFYRGAYQAASNAFSRLLLFKTRQPGYDLRHCALWYRHALACANYHNERAAMGIPEPPQLDPECGVAALAACLRGLSLPYDRQRLLSVSHVTGEGNDLADVLQAAGKLGVHAQAVTADDAGLIALPKPLVAYVESDHFIAVVQANKAGVSYLCSDCGAWPGGRVDLTWAQWHQLNAGLYAVVTKPGSLWDQALSTVLSSAASPDLKIASIGNLRGLGKPRFGVLLPVLSALRGHVNNYKTPQNHGCGYKPTSLQCSSHISCPRSCPRPKGKGPSLGDPVNLATGEEEYAPDPDLTVYNPVGPSVVWQRMYDSLRGQTPFYTETCPDTDYYDATLNDGVFGMGWSHSYNGYIDDPNYTANSDQMGYSHGINPVGGTRYLVLPNGGRVGFEGPNPQTPPLDNAVHNYSVSCPASKNGTPMLMQWNYQSQRFTGNVPCGTGTSQAVGGGPCGAYSYVFTQTTSYVITFADRSRETFTNYQPFYGTASADGTASAQYFCLTKITDRNGNSITINRDQYGSFQKIVNSQGTILLQLNSGTNGTYSVSDCYGRSVVYHSKAYDCTNVPKTSGGPNNVPLPQHYSLLDHVSQVVQAGASSPPDRWAYNYTGVQNPDITETIPFLSNITVPSPAGPAPTNASLTAGDTGTSTATINYSSDGNSFVTSLVDGNGYTYTYTPVAMQNVTTVTVSDKPLTTPGVTVYYTSQSSFNTDMSQTGETDGNGATVSQSVYSDMQNPYRPSSMKDASAIYRVVPGPTATTLFQNGTDHAAATGWDIRLSGTTVDAASASGATGANGWQVTYASGQFTVKAPASAAKKAHYEVRWGTATPGMSAYFDVGDIKAATQYVWDSYGNMTKMTDPRGTVTNFHYVYNNFALGELQSVQEVSAQSVSKTATTYTYYEPSGLVNTVQSPFPGTVGGTTATTTYTYNTLGDVTQVVTPGSNGVNGSPSFANITTMFSYTSDPAYSISRSAAIGQPLTMTDGLGKVTHMRYDAQGNQIAVIDAVGNETDTQYYDMLFPETYVTDSGGQTQSADNRARIVTYPIVTQTAPNGYPSSFSSYIRTRYLYPDGPQTQVISYGYTGDISNKPQQMRQVFYGYGPEGELKTVSGSTEPVIYTYDPLYRLNKLTDGGSSNTTYTYNSAGYLATVRYPKWGQGYAQFDKVALQYDDDGNVVSRTDGNNVVTSYEYNIAPDSQLTRLHYTYPTGYAGTQIGDVTFTYDGYGRRASMGDDTGTTAYGDGTASKPGYDDNDSPLNVITTYSALPTLHQTFTLTYGYNPDGSRRTMASPAGTFSYGYDGDGRMNYLLNPSSEPTQWTYLDNGWLNTQSLYNSTPTLVATTTYSYDAKGQMTRLLNQANGGTVCDFGTGSGILYDGVGSRTAMPAAYYTSPGGSAYTAFTGTLRYSYDYGQSATPYNNRSQLTQETFYRADEQTFPNAYAYDGGSGSPQGPGNPTQFRNTTLSGTYNTDNQYTASGFAYDGNGNPTTYKGTALTFDPENRLTSYGGTTLTCGYTGEGLRAWKRSGSGTPNYYLYDGEQPVCEIDGNPSGLGAIKRFNTWGANGLVSRVTVGSSTGFYVFDPQGNAAQRLNGDGSVAVQYQTDSYGSVASSSGGITFGYGGQWGYSQDSEDGLVLCTHRFYDPANGRWLTRDPISYNGGINLYGFCSNNSVNVVDPSGLYDSDGTNEIHTRPNPVYPGDYLESYVCHHPIGPGRNFPKPLRDAINDLGNTYGCHTCGSKDPGTESGNFVIDHQPPIRLNPDPDDEYAYTPQCLPCSNSQGGTVSHMPISNPRMLPPEVPVPPIEEVPIENGGAIGGAGGGAGPVGQRHLPFM